MLEKRRGFGPEQYVFAGWAMLIFATSALPREVFPQVSVVWLPKAVHVMFYFVFCFLAYRALKVQSSFPVLRRFAVPISLIISSFYAFSDETHQMFVDGRTAALSDVFIDISSALLFAATLSVASLVRSLKAGNSPA